jgi:hypothetical protein
MNASTTKKANLTMFSINSLVRSSTRKKNEVLNRTRQDHIHNSTFSVELTNGPNKLSFTLYLAGKACQGQTLELIEPIRTRK